MKTNHIAELLATVNRYVDSFTKDAKFTVSCPALIVTDPSYPVGAEGSIALDAVKQGEWLARAGYYRDPEDVHFFEGVIEEARKKIIDFEQLVDDPQDSFENEVLVSKDRLDNYVGRMAFLHITHSETQEFINFVPTTYSHHPTRVAVDSGRLGVFDQVLFASSVVGEHRETFVERIYNLTGGGFHDHSFGVVEFGVAVTTGYGDGAYDLFFKRDYDGKVVAMFMLLFPMAGEPTD